MPGRQGISFPLPAKKGHQGHRPQNGGPDEHPHVLVPDAVVAGAADGIIAQEGVLLPGGAGQGIQQDQEGGPQAEKAPGQIAPLLLQQMKQRRPQEQPTRQQQGRMVQLLRGEAVPGGKEEQD